MRLTRLVISIALAVLSVASMAQSQDLMGFDRSSFGSVVLSRTQAVGTGIQLEVSVGSYKNEPISNYKGTIFADIGKSVGRLDVLTDKGVFPCTAFIVSKQHILTNYHCSLGLLDDERIGATRIDASEFVAGYTQTGVDEGTKRYIVIPTPVEFSAELDYAVLEVLGNPSQDYGELKLANLVPNDRAPFWIIGHPQGKGQHISREKCRASTPAVSKNNLLHTCDTLPGNSGSPVIDAGLQIVVGLHYAGIANDSVNAAILMSKILEHSKVLAAYRAPEKTLKVKLAEPKTAAVNSCDALYRAAVVVNACYAYKAYINSCKDHSLAPISKGYMRNFCQPQESVDVDKAPVKTCNDDPSLCNTGKLCGQSVTFKSGKAEWRKDNISYVAEAKLRGLICGVTEVLAAPKKTCFVDVTKCSKKEICKAATLDRSNGKIWDRRSVVSRHVTEAKLRGLSCGVVKVVAAPKKTCTRDIRQCSAELVCSRAVLKISSKISWDTKPYNSKHVTEAKRRGLSCGVNEMVAKAEKKQCDQDANVCDVKRLCQLAVIKKNWETRLVYQKHVIEAKRRGLTCGVKGGRCSQDVRYCIDSQICTQATVSHSQQKKWSSFSAHIAEAKRRELTCGVNETKSIKTAFKNESVLRRKQIQYALMKLNYYRSSIDALYGPGTERALTEFARVKGLNINKPESVFKSILGRVGVPNSFADPEQKKCSQNAKSCIASRLCYFATNNYMTSKIWANEPEFSTHVSEAKRRGLTCGVNYTDTIKTEITITKKTPTKKKGISPGAAFWVLRCAAGAASANFWLCL